MSHTSTPAGDPAQGPPSGSGSGDAPAPAAQDAGAGEATDAAREDDAPWGLDDAVTDAPVDLRLHAPRIPGYRVHALIGRGATGLVYRATQQAVDRQVALKVLHPELVADRRAVLRLQREARLAACLAHPSIISAIDMGDVDGRWWYAMELVQGMSLQRRIALRGPLSERECLRLFSPLCDALQHAHEVGVVHRDIKPANVLIDRRARARLVDLGLAMSQNDPSVTRSGGTLGTPHYVSPEQARDPRKADTRSDLWSLGATMYHAVCGRPPFEGESVAEILSHVLHDPVPDPREFAPELSRGFALMLGKCLTRDPERRYQEPWELVADIELLRERRRPDVRAGAVDPFASRRPAWVGRAAPYGAAVLLVSATWLAASRPWEPAPTPPPGPSLEQWPELVHIRDGFEEGTLRHADALAELSSASLSQVLGDDAVLKNRLVQSVKAGLQDEVERLLAELDGALEAALTERRFADAAALISERLPAELRAVTGYADAIALPQGRTRILLGQWADAAARRVAGARETAFEAAVASFQEAYPRTVERRIDELLAARRWRTALEVLDPATPLSWLALAAGEVDLAGLSEADQRAAAVRLAASVDVDRARVRGSMVAAFRELEQVIADERERLGARERILSNLEHDPGALLREAYGRKREGDGVDLDELTPELSRRLDRALEQASASLSDDWRRARREAAQITIVGLEDDATRLRGARDYAAEAELWRDALAEGWRASTHDLAQLRLLEAERLEALLARAAAGLVARSGARVAFTFADLIRREGTLESGPDPLRGGAEFRGRGMRRTLWLRRSQHAGDGRATEEVLRAEDVLALAGLDGARLDPVDSLRIAAFLLAEGRPLEAAQFLRLEEVAPEDDEYAADLYDRIQAAGDELRTRRSAREEQLRYELAGLRSALRGATLDPRRKLTRLEAFLEDFGPDLDAPTLAELGAARAELEAAPPEGSFEEIYGVPNSVSVGKQARLTFDLTRSEGRGRWIVGQWDTGPEGLVLDEALVSDVRFKATDSGPHLSLLPPLDTDAPLTVRLRLRADSDPGRPQLFAVTVADYHLVLLDGRAQPRAWFGTGDLWALIDSAVQGGDADEVDGFSMAPFDGVRVGEPFEVELTLRTWSGALELASVDGKKLALSRQYRQPTSPRSFLYVRSREPATFLRAELEGQRLPRRD